VNGEEDAQQIFERRNLWVEGDLDHFSVSGATCAHLFIRRVGLPSTCVARLDMRDALQLIIHRF